MPVAIIVDNSQAMAPTITELRRALTAFMTGIDGLGPVALVTVADRPTIALGYTTSLKDMLAAANRLFHAPSSGATLLDAISEVAKGLAKREARPCRHRRRHRRVHRVQPCCMYQDVLEDVRDSGAALHAVVLTNPEQSLDQRRGAQSRHRARPRARANRAASAWTC